MARLIDANMLKKSIDQCRREHRSNKLRATVIKSLIDAQPIVTEQTAEIAYTWPETQRLAQCTRCAALVGSEFKHCPNCGTKFTKEAHR